MQPLIDADVLRSLLEYNSETGIFVNRVHRSPNAKCKSVAGSLQNTGYISIEYHGEFAYIGKEAVNDSTN